MSTAQLTTSDGLLARLVDAAYNALFAFKLNVSATDVARAVSVLSLGVVFGLVVSF